MQQPFMPPWRGPCYCLQCPLPQLARLLLDLLWNQLRNHLLFEVTPWSASFSWSSLLSLDSILKSRDLTLLTKLPIVKAMVFPVVMYRCESWVKKKGKRQTVDSFQLWCWRRLLRVPWTARRSNQSILKEINPEYSSEGLMLKLKLQYLAIWCKEMTHWKRPWCWERLKAGGEGDDRGWHGSMTSSTWWTWV